MHKGIIQYNKEHKQYEPQVYLPQHFNFFTYVLFSMGFFIFHDFNMYNFRITAITIAVDQPKIMIPIAASEAASSLHCPDMVISPYPSVVNVTMEKYKESAKEARAPVITYANAQTTDSTMDITKITKTMMDIQYSCGRL